MDSLIPDSTETGAKCISICEFIDNWTKFLPTNLLENRLNILASERADESALAQECDVTKLIGSSDSSVIEMNDLDAPELFSIDYLRQNFKSATHRGCSDADLMLNIDEWIKQEVNYLRSSYQSVNRPSSSSSQLFHEIKDVDENKHSITPSAIIETSEGPTDREKSKCLTKHEQSNAITTDHAHQSILDCRSTRAISTESKADPQIPIYNDIPVINKSISMDNHSQMIYRENQALLTVHIFSPHYKWRHRVRTLRQELVFNSDQYLSDLVDSIVCSCDIHRPGNFANDPDAVEHAPTAKQLHPSCFLYINETFYSDAGERSDGNDPCVPIMDWIRKYGCVGQRSQLKGVRLRDLNIILGRPYLYSHIDGACDHAFIFSDIRMRSIDDVWQMSKYPLHTNRQRINFATCFICNRIPACWLVENSSLLVDDTCLMCDICFRSSHYANQPAPDNKQTRLCPDFDAFHYAQAN